MAAAKGYDYKDVVIVHGNARGADTLAASVADELGMDVESHPAQWNEHGKRAGMIRNQEMVDLGADICLSFPISSSVGTFDCMRRAEKAGIRVVKSNVFGVIEQPVRIYDGL